jgi:hypothetical protein
VVEPWESLAVVVIPVFKLSVSRRSIGHGSVRVQSKDAVVPFKIMIIDHVPVARVASKKPRSNDFRLSTIRSFHASAADQKALDCCRCSSTSSLIDYQRSFHV